MIADTGWAAFYSKISPMGICWIHFHYLRFKFLRKQMSSLVFTLMWAAGRQEVLISSYAFNMEISEFVSNICWNFPGTGCSLWKWRFTTSQGALQKGWETKIIARELIYFPFLGCREFSIICWGDHFILKLDFIINTDKPRNNKAWHRSTYFALLLVYIHAAIST